MLPFRLPSPDLLRFDHPSTRPLLSLVPLARGVLRDNEIHGLSPPVSRLLNPRPAELHVVCHSAKPTELLCQLNIGGGEEERKLVNFWVTHTHTHTHTHLVCLWTDHAWRY